MRLSCLVLISLAACSEPPAPDGAALYAQYCALCHGDEGEGYAADDANALGNQDFLMTASDSFLRESIEHGRPGTPMSAWGRSHGGPLSAREIDALVDFMRGWQTEPSVEVDRLSVHGTPGNGRPVFMERCAGCHGDHGEGLSAVSLDNPRFLASASDGYIRWAIEHGRRGTAMQAYGAELPPQALNDLTALIRSWQREVEAPPGEMPPPSYDEIVIHPDGPHAEVSLREERFVPADDVMAALESGARIVLLDARATSDFHAGHIPGALSVPFYGADGIYELLPRDGTLIVAYCACPHAASGRVVDRLNALDFPRTAVLDEGVVVWEERGYPMTEPETSAED